MDDDSTTENDVVKHQENGKCKCGAPGEPEHPCPFSQDVYNDHERLCNCCPNCERRCAYDI